MNAGAGKAPTVFHWRDVMRGGEPPPAAFLARQPFHPWLVVGVTCIGAFIGQLDASIVQLALPALTQTLGSVGRTRCAGSPSPICWRSPPACRCSAGSAKCSAASFSYLIGFADLHHGISACADCTDHFGWLIAFRVLQGIGGGLLGANSIAILVTSVDSRDAPGPSACSRRRRRSASAPARAGGVAARALGWQWVFWAAVPFGFRRCRAWAGSCCLATTDLPATGRFDWLGRAAARAIAGAGNPDPQSGLGLAAGVAADAPVIAEPLSSFALVRLPGAHGAVTPRRSELCSAARLRRRHAGVRWAMPCSTACSFLMSFALLHGFHNSAAVAGFKLAIIPVAMA